MFVRAQKVQTCSFLLVSRPPTDTPNLVRRTESGHPNRCPNRISSPRTWTPDRTFQPCKSVFLVQNSFENRKPCRCPVAPTTKGICLHNARHLPPKFTHSKASAHALTGICPHNQTHIPPGKSPSSAAKSQRMKARPDRLVSMLLPLETFWYDLSSSAFDVLETFLA